MFHQIFSTAHLPRLPVYAMMVLLLNMPALGAERRHALVIGNSSYAGMPLLSVQQDAAAIAAKLTSLGFRVERVENLKRREIGRTIASFVKQIEAGDTALVYYTGHGIQVKGTNYLPAVDAQIEHEDDVALNSVNLSTLLDRLDETKATVKLLLIDASRPNSFAPQMRSSARGLARVTSAPSGTLVQFAARPGTAVMDNAGKPGLYAKALVDELGTPGTPLELTLKRVSMAVSAASHGEQVPWAEGSMTGDFYFSAGAADERRTQAVQEVQIDWNAWQGQMQASFDETEKFTGTPAGREEAWSRFLDAWRDNNPASTQDESLRQRALTLKAALVKPPAMSRRAPAGHAAPSVWQWPADGTTMSTTGFSGNTGVLIGGTPGTPVVAAAEGRVFYVGAYKGANVVAITHGEDAFVSMYYHLQNIKVKRQQKVARGEQIAEMGTSGPPGVGLSFEIKDAKQTFMPIADMLPPREASN